MRGPATRHAYTEGREDGFTEGYSAGYAQASVALIEQIEALARAREERAAELAATHGEWAALHHEVGRAYRNLAEALRDSGQGPRDTPKEDG